MGWCKFIIKPFLEPYTELKWMSKIEIVGEEGETFILACRNVQCYDSIIDAVNPDNYSRVVPGGEIMTLECARYLASLMIAGPRSKAFFAKHNRMPKVLVIEVMPYDDPKEVRPNYRRK